MKTHFIPCWDHFVNTPRFKDVEKKFAEGRMDMATVMAVFSAGMAYGKHGTESALAKIPASDFEAWCQIPSSPPPTVLQISQAMEADFLRGLLKPGAAGNLKQ